MQHKPLENIRVLELGGYISAPYASSLLCALGADVVKVENAGGGDAYRFQQNDRSPFFRQYNAGKRSLGVNLKNPAGLQLVEALVPRFDVVLENMRPGKATALGLGPDHCSALAPALVYASVTGFGPGGPLAQRPAYDTIGQAVGGLYSVLSDAGSPQLSGTCVADLITGLTTATGILAALVGRASTGAGQRVETSLMEAVSTLTIEALTQYFDKDHQEPTRQSRHPQAQNFCLATSTGENIAIHLSSSQKFWLCFLEALDRQDLSDDPRFLTFALRVQHYFELVEIVEAEFIGKPAQYWEQRLTAADVPFSPVLTMGGFIEHPQVDWLDLIEPEKDGIALVRPPWRFGGQRPERPGPAPKIGQHTREVAGEVYDEVRIKQLFADEVIFEELEA
ncbi:CaiB/BaiF CoA transferase family protein [Rhodococcus sp. NPDC127530]|uniref:CaiB/BaiF CoA transferase family protein n=1 Tax=unclassified Rhodococcus (in: high G+C Gram-positive bacteria) TaxID=192944 RepID=UPI0036280635